MSNVIELFGSRSPRESGAAARLCNEGLDKSLETIAEDLHMSSLTVNQRDVNLRFLPSPGPVELDDGAIYNYRSGSKLEAHIVVSDGFARFIQRNVAETGKKAESARLTALYAAAYGVGVLIGLHQRVAPRSLDHIDDLWNRVRVNSSGVSQPYRFAAAITNNAAISPITNENIVLGDDRILTAHAASFANPLSIYNVRGVAAGLFKDL